MLLLLHLHMQVKLSPEEGGVRVHWRAEVEGRGGEEVAAALTRALATAHGLKEVSNITGYCRHFCLDSFTIFNVYYKTYKKR